MGNPVHPKVFRIGVNQSHDSVWFAKSDATYRKFVEQDNEIRAILLKRLGHVGLGRVVIERPAQDSVSISLEAVKPGFVIGQKGKDIDNLSSFLKKKTNLSFSISVQEIRSPDSHAGCVAAKIARQLKARIQYRRAMKGAVAAGMRAGAKGIKITCKGCISRIARPEKKHEGSIPLSTIRETIDFAIVHAVTRSGKIGVRVTICHGPKLNKAADRSLDRPRQKSSEENSERPHYRDRPYERHSPRNQAKEASRANSQVEMANKNRAG